MEFAKLIALCPDRSLHADGKSDVSQLYPTYIKQYAFCSFRIDLESLFLKTGMDLANYYFLPFCGKISCNTSDLKDF